MTSQIFHEIDGARFGINDSGQLVLQNPTTGAQYAMTPVPNADLTATAANLNLLEQTNNATTVGAGSGVTGVAVAIQRQGNFAILTFTLTAVAVTLTDAGAGGAGGGVKLFDFVQQSVQCLGSRTNLSAIASDTTLDVGGDLALIHALGSAVANAGDLALTGTEVDFAPVSGTVTLSANAGSSASVTRGPGAAAADGTSTAADLYLNFSASAATADATGVLTVTGTITAIFALLGDD